MQNVGKLGQVVFAVREQDQRVARVGVVGLRVLQRCRRRSSVSSTRAARRWFVERSTMQAFGRREDLLAAKLAEVTSASEQLGKVLARMMQQRPDLRISAAELAEALLFD